ncbi:MAG: hypothetical protein PHQ33_08610, partial [Bacteroidales bacterium]|nr:hypothetical protein [Bacteroidales bacterium]
NNVKQYKHIINTTITNKSMSTDKIQNKYRIQSARAPWHGYDGGVDYDDVGRVCRDVARNVSTIQYGTKQYEPYQS